MKVKTLWHGREFPHNWEFYAQCDEGNDIEIAIKNNESTRKIAPNPKELVLQAMAGCTAVDVVSMLQKMRQPLKNLLVEVEAELTEEHPKVFSHCKVTYQIEGEGLNLERVAHSVNLSYTKYCGVSAMIERSGCLVMPYLFVNSVEIDIFDPLNELKSKLKTWLKNKATLCQNGIALVTGCSRGIGKELVFQLQSNGYAVIPTARSKINFDNEFVFDSLYLDVTKTESILYLAHFLKNSNVTLSLLLHNAGVYAAPGKLEALSLEHKNLRFIYESNVFGLIELNTHLQMLVKENGIVAMIASLMGHPTSDSYTSSAYRLSKSTVLQYVRQIALQCKDQNIKHKILSLHPGSVQTDMNPTGKISVQESAKNITNLILKIAKEPLNEIQNGAFWTVDSGTQDWKCI